MQRYRLKWENQQSDDRWINNANLHIELYLLEQNER